MSDAKAAFAKAVQTSPKEISEFIAVPIAAGEVDAIWPGSYKVSGEPQTWAVAVCGARPCPGQPVSLPTASSLAVVALVDLQGTPFKLDLQRPPKDAPRA